MSRIYQDINVAIVNLILFIMDLPALIMLIANIGKDHRTGKRTASAILLHTLCLAGAIGLSALVITNFHLFNSALVLAMICLGLFALGMAAWITLIIVSRPRQR